MAKPNPKLIKALAELKPIARDRKKLKPVVDAGTSLSGQTPGNEALRLKAIAAAVLNAININVEQSEYKHLHSNKGEFNMEWAAEPFHEIRGNGLIDLEVRKAQRGLTDMMQAAGLIRVGVDQTGQPFYKHAPTPKPVAKKKSTKKATRKEAPTDEVTVAHLFV